MGKIDMKFCRCARIHFYSNDLLSQLLNDEKELVLICSKCGDVIHIGADKEPATLYDESADSDDFSFSMYSYHEEKEEITKDNFVPAVMNRRGKRTIGKIIIDEGIGVPMMTGFDANYKNCSGFVDTHSNFIRLKTYSSVAEMEKDMTEYDEMRVKVNMDCLLKKLTDEQADVLSKYYIKGLDWSGTKFQK